MRNAKLDEAQAGIKIAGKNINNCKYVDDTILMAESKEELKSFLMKVKEESENDGLKFNIQKTKIWSYQFSLVQFSSVAQSCLTLCWSHHFMANRWGNNGNSERLYFLQLQNHCRW